MQQVDETGQAGLRAIAHASQADAQAGGDLMKTWFEFLKTLREIEERDKAIRARMAEEERERKAEEAKRKTEQGLTSKESPNAEDGLAAKRSSPLAGQPQKEKCVMNGLKRQAAAAPRKGAMLKRGPQVSRSMAAKPAAAPKAAPQLKLGK